jgi:hypothetical protein
MRVFGETTRADFKGLCPSGKAEAFDGVSTHSQASTVRSTLVSQVPYAISFCHYQK